MSRTTTVVPGRRTRDRLRPLEPPRAPTSPHEPPRAPTSPTCPAWRWRGSGDDDRMRIDAPDDTGAHGAPVTIGTIAREAGVSVATVSKVVNGRVDVSAATRERVEAVIRRHGYRPRRASSAAGSGLLELVFHELDSPWALEIIASVERVAGQHRMAVVLTELGGAHRPRQQWLDDVHRRRPLGVILVQAELA